MKNVSYYVILAAVIAIGGWFYYVHRESFVTQIVEVPSATSTNPTLPAQQDDELAKKRQAGIGSVKDLKPVPLGSGTGQSR
jgi:hypothetical protein